MTRAFLFALVVCRYDPVRPKLLTERRHPVKDFELMYSLAHLELWAHVIANKIPYALVFEDDAFVQGLRPAGWMNLFEHVSPKWDEAGSYV